MCTGKPAGCEAAIHGMRQIFQDTDTEAVLLIDAKNAFNSINRETALHNINVTCPVLANFAANCYNVPSRIFIAGGKEISSEEGFTQGNPLAMDLYAIGMVPLLDSVKYEITNCKQVAYADDNSGSGKIEQVKEWWESIQENGPKYGYLPEPSKSWLITKPQHEEKARQAFRDSAVKITTEGHKQLGASLGSEDYKQTFVKDKVKEWVSEVNELSEIAKTVPHSAYSAFVQGLRHRWTSIMRTIPDISDLLEPLEKAIRENLIPAICGKKVNDIERNLLALPARLGGMGIINPVESANFEYESSCELTAEQQEFVANQKADGKLNTKHLNSIKLAIKQRRSEVFSEKLEKVVESLDTSKRRLLESVMEKGASSWLSCLPLKSEGYNLNKQEFRDSVKLRYGWELEGLPATCKCGRTFTIHHASSCKVGGFIHMRHNDVRDITAKLLDEVCHNVAIEPALIPLSGEHLHLRSANRAEEARLDVSASGFWNRGQRAFFDVRVFDSSAPRLLNKSLKSIHKTHELEKRRAYNQRILNVEQGSFTPLVFSAVGGQAYECQRFYNQLATLISEKRGELKSQTMTFIRCKINFSLLRSALLCVRGTRSINQEYQVNTSSDLANVTAGVL
jgi:hypothetical protein